MEWVVGVKPMKMKFSGRECAMFQFFVAQEARQSQPEELGQGVYRIFQSDFPLCFLTSFTTFWIIRPPCTFGPYHLLYNIYKLFCISTFTLFWKKTYYLFIYLLFIYSIHWLQIQKHLFMIYTETKYLLLLILHIMKQTFIIHSLWTCF